MNYLILAYYYKFNLIPIHCVLILPSLVADGISMETRATVNKLKPKQFSMLVSQAEVSDEILDIHSASLNVLDHELDEALIGESNLEEIDAHEEPEIIPQTTR
jgi:hypothetical protein